MGVGSMGTEGTYRDYDSQNRSYAFGYPLRRAVLVSGLKRRERRSRGVWKNSRGARVWQERACDSSVEKGASWYPSPAASGCNLMAVTDMGEKIRDSRYCISADRQSHHPHRSGAHEDGFPSSNLPQERCCVLHHWTAGRARTPDLMPFEPPVPLGGWV